MGVDDRNDGRGDGEQRYWRCFGCSTLVRPGMGDWCRCIRSSREEWAALQRAANPKKHADAPASGAVGGED